MIAKAMSSPNWKTSLFLSCQFFFTVLVRGLYLSTCQKTSPGNVTSRSLSERAFLFNSGLPQIIPLGGGLVAELQYEKSGRYMTTDFDVVWPWLINKVLADAKSSTYRSGSSASRYNVWPATATFMNDLSSHPVVFDLAIFESSCRPQAITSDILVRVVEIFRKVEKALRLRDASEMDGVVFSGFIRSEREILFTFNFFEVYKDFAEAERTRDIKASDLATLNVARAIILEQTTKDDLLLFLGNTGAYFYWTLNRPDDMQDLKRNTHLVPFSGGSDRHLYPLVAKTLLKSSLYATYVKNVLKPIFATYSPNPGSTSKVGGRVIVVDYVQSGHSLAGFRNILQESGLLPGTLSVIKITDATNPRPLRAINRVEFLSKTIDIDKEDVVDGLIDGGVGRIMPVYNWFVWEIPWKIVYYPDQQHAQHTIDAIQCNCLD